MGDKSECIVVDWEVCLSRDCLFGTTSLEWVGTVIGTLRVYSEQQTHKCHSSYTYHSFVVLAKYKPSAHVPSPVHSSKEKNKIIQCKGKQVAKLGSMPE